MERAFAYVYKKKGSVREAAEIFNIPRTSIHYKMNNPRGRFGSGLTPSLLENEEADLIEFIAELSKRGFPRKKENIKTSIQDYLKNQPRACLFEDKRPSDTWYFRFLKRHRKKLDAIENFSLCKTKSDLRTWFKKIEDYIGMENIFHAAADPQRVFIADETCFHICAKTGKVLIEGITASNLKVSAGKITVIHSYTANGISCNPMIVYPFEKVPDLVADSVPVGWSFGRNKTGCMTPQIFYEYITDILITKIKEDEIELPVILFVDGNKACVTLEVLELCKSMQIHLIAIYHNLNKILSPNNAALLRPIKSAWKKALKVWHAEKNCEANATIITFAPFLENVINTHMDMDELNLGFHCSGLYPLGFDNVALHVDSFSDEAYDTDRYNINSFSFVNEEN